MFSRLCSLLENPPSADILHALACVGALAGNRAGMIWGGNMSAVVIRTNAREKKSPASWQVNYGYSTLLYTVQTVGSKSRE